MKKLYHFPRILWIFLLSINILIIIYFSFFLGISLPFSDNGLILRFELNPLVFFQEYFLNIPQSLAEQLPSNLYNEILWEHMQGVYRQIFGNVALFVPLGCILAILYKQFSIIKLIIIGFWISFWKEIIQIFISIWAYIFFDKIYILVFDSADILLNICGFILGLVFWKLYNKYLSQK